MLGWRLTVSQTVTGAGQRGNVHGGGGINPASAAIQSVSAVPDRGGGAMASHEIAKVLDHSCGSKEIRTEVLGSTTQTTSESKQNLCLEGSEHLANTGGEIAIVSKEVQGMLHVAATAERENYAAVQRGAVRHRGLYGIPTLSPKACPCPPNHNQKYSL